MDDKPLQTMHLGGSKALLFNTISLRLAAYKDKKLYCKA